MVAKLTQRYTMTCLWADNSNNNNRDDNSDDCNNNKLAAPN